ncbi:MAG: radical SAM protein, partial [bacterium]|nr:radical SAM protein [bacterium]
VHLPVQSGSSDVLRRMQREYNREQYLERIRWIREARHPIGITTDIIVGFPGETEADFEQTLALLDEVGYDQVFSFQYSPRPNTAALQFEDAIPVEEKGRRLRVLQERQKQIQLERYQTHVGTVQEVLVEGQGGRAGQWKGRTTQNIVLNFIVPSPQAVPVRPGDYWNVRVTQAGPTSLVGEAVDGPVFYATPPSHPHSVASPFSIL